MANQALSRIGGRTVVANYVATCRDLATMARRSGLDTLGYLLEMVRLEAENDPPYRTAGASHGLHTEPSRNAAVGLPSGTMPSLTCSARMLSRRSKSMWPSKSSTL